MHRYDVSNLIIHAGNSDEPDVIVDVQPEQSGLEHVHLQVRRIQAGGSWSFETGDNEAAIVALGGSITIESNRGGWRLGGRANVFAGLPTALYVPRHTTLTASADTAAEYAVAWAATDRDNAPRYIAESDIQVELRGGDNVSRQVNDIIPPGFGCQRLVVVEVYTPSGNWSSYPPHKHDVHKTDASGRVVEADLEEIYYYKIDKPGGFAVQRIYTAEESPLHRAGQPIDAVVVAHDNDAVLVPEGYHPVSSAPGYTTYYLNILAGSAQSLANSEDPQHVHVKQTYRGHDPRLPLYPITS